MKHSASEGQSPIAKELISLKSLVYDVVYNPIKTPLLKSAEEVGARTLGGFRSIRG